MSELFTVNNKLQSALEALFLQHRLVFWYDEKAEMTTLFQSINIPNVQNIEIKNNEFSLKYKFLIEQPNQKFLVYQPKAKPIAEENWLLDLLLSNYEFHTEPSSLYIQELGLTAEYKPLVENYIDFFSNQIRLNSFKELLEPDDRESKLKLKMLAVICNCEIEWDKILYVLFTENFKNKQEKFKAIINLNLGVFLWETIEKKYTYKSNNPTIKDLLLQLVQNDFERSTNNTKPILNKEAYIFINRWKENTKSYKIFEDWSFQLEKDLSIESHINDLNIDSLLDADTYSVIDKKIIIGLRSHIINNTLPNYTIQEWIEKRKVKFFHKEFSNLYESLSFAATLLDEIRKINLTVSSPKDGFDKYEKQWFLVDKLYRKYIYSSEQGSHTNLLRELTSQIENAYGNSYLLKLGDNWQEAINNLEVWNIESTINQKQFYPNWIEPYTKKDNRIFVIISDALRYESAAELKDLVLQEDRYTANLSAVLGSIPSYTQLGMASLLPHTNLSFNNESDTVFADNISTQGTDNRTKVLQKRYEGSIAISAEEFLKLNSKFEGRDFIKPYNVIYIYSNHIDKTGDDKTSESKVFEATEVEFKNILKIIKHINNMNGYNMIVTADHGYLYQHNKLDESDFTDFAPLGSKIYKTNRRFIIGQGLIENQAVQKWNGNNVGFSDETEIQISKSINRIRVQGAGSRFVHGGSTLQEIVVPVLEINKARRSDIDKVDVEIISGSSVITSNTFAVVFYQKQAIAEKILPRQIKASFYSASGKLISDVITLNFNSTENDAIAREKRQAFNFIADATKLNKQDVTLKLEEQIEGTNQFSTYKTFKYQMAIAFSSEFDDF